MKRGSPTGFEVRIRFIVMFGKSSFLGFFLGCGAAEPFLVMRRAEARVITRARDEALIVQLCAEIQGVGVGDHVAWVSRCAQETPADLFIRVGFGPANFDVPV